jgi:hypothetical protein
MKLTESSNDIPYFVNSYIEAQNRFNAGVDGKRGIASAIYPAQSTDLGNADFPYRQIIRGDGACYLNACLVGILNKCVGDEKKLQEFKANLNIKYPSTNDIINQIELRAKIDSDGTSQNGLDRKKLNQMLQDKENQNLGTQLAKEILISKHQELIDNYNKNKAKLEDVIKESESNKTKYTENYLDAFNEYIKTSDGLALLDKTPPTFDENYERNVKIMKDHFQKIHYHQNSKNDPDKNNPFKILRGLAGNPSEDEDKRGIFESITNKINNIQKEIANKEGYKNLILSVINNNNFATSYEEDMLFRIAEELTEGMGSNGGKLIIQSFVRLALEDTSFQEDYNIDRIYLINLDGNAHFDLMYNKGDPICAELESQDNQATQTREDKKINEQQERSKLITEIKELKKNSQNVSKDLINEILNDNKLEDVNLARLKLLKSIYEASTLAFEEIIKNEGPDQELFEAYFQAIKEGDQATQDENLHTNFPESVQELEDKIKTDIIIGKQLEIFNQLFEQNRVKKDNKQNLKEHVELGMDWWVFPGYTDNHDQDKFTATEEIYKLLARDQKYCQRYKTFIYQYMDSFDIDEEITHKIRFSKLVESLIGMTNNGERTLAGFTQKEQDILFITVNNFYKEKGGEGLIYNENYTKHFQNLEKIAGESKEIDRNQWIPSAREKLRARLELGKGETSSGAINKRTKKPIFEKDKRLDKDQQDDFLERSNPYSLNNKIGCGRLTDTIEGLEASYPFCHFRITHDPIAMRDNTSPIAKVKPIDKAEYLKHPPITAICIDYPDYRNRAELPESKELKGIYKQKTLETLTLYDKLEVDHLVKHGDGMGVFLKQTDINGKRENRSNEIISYAFKDYLDGFFEAVTEFYDTNPQATLKKITFVTPDEVLERIFNEKLNEFKSNTSNSKILDSVEFKQDKAGPRFNSSKYYEQGAKKLGMTIAPNGDKKFLGGALNKGNVLEELITLLSDMASIGNPVFNPNVLNIIDPATLKMEAGANVVTPASELKTLTPLSPLLPEPTAEKISSASVVSQINNPDSSTSASPTSTLPPSTSPDFSFSCNDVGSEKIIKFKIKDPEVSDENLAGSSGGVGKFDYIKQLSAEETYNEGDYNEELERENILNLLKEASDATQKKFQGLDDNFFIAVMKVASENLGISRIEEEKFNACFDTALKKIDQSLDATKYKLEEGNTLHKIAKYFSANFQELSMKNKYLTARPGVPENTINPIGRRLFRVCTEENINAFKEKLNSPSPSPENPELKAHLFQRMK